MAVRNDRRPSSRRAGGLVGVVVPVEDVHHRRQPDPARRGLGGLYADEGLERVIALNQGDARSDTL
jgi:hypothetical protein